MSMENDDFSQRSTRNGEDAPPGQPCVAIRFCQKLELYWLPDVPGETLRLGPSLFQWRGLTRPMPHYDWLRTTGGPIIGLRYWPLEEETDAEFVQTFFSAVAGVCERVGNEGGYIEIFFSEARAYDGDWSCDQAFGTTEIYCGEAGDYALVLGTDWLGETEIVQLRASNFNWMNQ
jgi:hypothetical protein